ncbi:protein mono-ADP-ribosyltransferase PARP14-like [Clavelina lepadiformis]|uniref:protein mono-ADP-ribosyltransferase PARP14-like n=1 Tax=Clavelina lepadiformis TaxID=159417 RepID=UPI0040428010
MVDSGNASYKVSVTGLPKKYGLDRAKNIIHEHLETEDAISDIDFAEKKDGTKNCRVAFVTLKKEEYQQKLVAMAVIEAKFQKTQFKLNITKARPRIKSTSMLMSGASDAEKVAEISRTKKIEIVNQTVDVSLCDYNPCLNKNKKEKEDAKQSRSQTSSRKSCEFLCAFHYSPVVEKEVIEFIKKSSTHLNLLSKEFEELSSVKLKPKRSSGKQSSNFVVRFEPLPKNEGKTNQTDFESECSTRIMNFLRKFDSRPGHFGSKGLDKLRKSNLWTNNDCDIIKIEIDRSTDVSVLARWNHPKDGDFIIAGLENEVSQAFRWVQSKIKKENKTEMSEFVKEWQLEFLKDCGILDEIRSKFKNTTVSVSDEDCKVTFRGLKVDVENSRTDILKQLRKIESSRLTFLEDDKLDFLTRVLKQTGQKSEIDVAQFIKSQFRQEKLKCVLQCSSELKLKYILERDLERANAILNEIVQRRSIPVKAGLSELLDAEEWKKFEESLCSSRALAVNVNRQNSTIVLIGVAKCLEEGEFRLNEYVKENAVGSNVIEMPYPVARFLSEYPNEVGLDEKLKNVEWYPTSDGSGGLMVQGKADKVKSAFANLKKLIPSIKIDPHDVSEPGMPGYFRSDIGGQFLKTTQAITKCIILVDTDKDPKWKKATPASKILAIGTTPLLTTKIPNTKVTVNVIKNDITEHATDAIVNASNTELELQSTGVSGSISKKGGSNIQQEMSIQRKRVGGELAAGLAVTTSAGNLPCKKIIHAVGPMWHSQADSWSRQSLKDAVKSSLSEADSFNLRSIAIPAISCGVFGGKPKVCTKLIVQALVE